jgi:hypothetical protein
MSLSTSPLLPKATGLISDFCRGINPLTVAKPRRKRRQTKTGKRRGNCNALSDIHSKLLSLRHLIQNIMSLIIDNGEQNASLHGILSSY